MRTAIFLMAAIGLLLAHTEAWAQPPLEQPFPGRLAGVMTEAEGTGPAGTVVRAAAEAPRTLLPDQVRLESRASEASTKRGVGTESVIGTSAIVGALIGTFVGGGIGYLIVRADNRTSNFWETGPLVVVPTAATGFFIGGAIGAILGKPRG